MEAVRDQNHVPVALGVSDADSTVTLPFKIDSITGRLLVDNAGSGGFTIVAVTGTVDDSNVTFTAATEPTALVINGGIYQKTGGSITWTYVGTTITLSFPVGTGGSIFGLS